MKRREFITAATALASVVLPPVAFGQKNGDELDISDDDINADIEAEVAFNDDCTLQAMILKSGVLGTRSAPVSTAATPKEIADAVKVDIKTLQSWQKSGTWYQLPPSSRPPVSWPKDAECADYCFMANTPVTLGTRVNITNDLITRVAKANAFDFNKSTRSRSRVVIGIRGAVLASGGRSTDWQDSHTIITTRPDHLTKKCLIGIWDRETRKIKLFQSSTVTEVNYIYRSLGFSDKRASLLSTGLYRYRRGTHRPGPGREQRAALKQDNAAVVLRCLDDMQFNPFSPHSVWQLGYFGINIHAAVLDGKGDRPKFSSAGCQVIPGQFPKGQFDHATGEFETFRRDMGLVGADNMPLAEEGGSKGTYWYMLLTGDDYAAVAALSDDELAKKYAPLRQGSSGERVKNLQTALQKARLLGRVDSEFSAETGLAVLRWHKKTLDQYTTPVFHSV